jgi:hypothetical protein
MKIVYFKVRGRGWVDKAQDCLTIGRCCYASEWRFSIFGLRIFQEYL